MVDYPPDVLIGVRRVISSTGPTGSLVQAQAVLEVIEPYIAAREAEAEIRTKVIEADAALVTIRSREVSAREEFRAAAIRACQVIARERNALGVSRHAGIAVACANAIREIKL